MAQTDREPQPPAMYEFEIHRNGQRFWTDAWIITPATERCGAIQVKHHWWVKKRGELLRNEHAFIYRWLRSDAQRARLKPKQQ